MSTSVTGVVSHFPSAENGFTTTTSGSVASGALTVGLNSVAGYVSGEVVVFVIDPTDVVKKQTFTGIMDTSGVQVTSVVWTAGTNQIHALGATVVDYATATHISMVSKGLLVAHNQDGTLKTNAVSSAAMLTTGVVTAPKLSTELQKGWLNDINGTTVPAPNTITNNGNRSYNLVVNATDLTSSLSPGMRLRTTRTVPTTNQSQSASLNGTTQSFSNATAAGHTFTDDFVAGGWVKLSSYPTGDAALISRVDANNGWWLGVTSDGTVLILCRNGGPSNFSYSRTRQSIPLNKWVHIAAQLDASAFTASTTTSYIMLDGVDVPTSVTRAGTNPTAIVQAGNLEVGSYTAANFFSGKIAQAFVTSAKLTQTQVKAIYNQGITTADTTTYNMVSAYSLSGAGGLTDLNTTNNNTLTANGSAVTTNADAPFGGQAGGTISSTLDYGIIQAISFSTNTTITVSVPEGNTIPTSGGVSALAYSTQKAPYGMPIDEDKWTLRFRWSATTSNSASIAGVWSVMPSSSITYPVGVWKQDSSMKLTGNASTSISFTIQSQWDTALPTVNRDGQHVERANSSTNFLLASHRHVDTIVITTPTVYQLYALMTSGSGTQVFYNENFASILYLKNAYL